MKVFKWKLFWIVLKNLIFGYSAFQRAELSDSL